MSESLAAKDGISDEVGDSVVIPKIIRRLIPFLCLLFVVNYLDRTNISMAKLRMQGDLKLSEEIYGTGAGIFFIGYFLFEVPSNLILDRVGARRWIARIMISWGILSGAMMLTRGPWSFYGLRFLLGVAEAGFFPGIVLYISYWIPARRRAKVLATFLTSTAVSGIVGNPLAACLMMLDGQAGLRGWQWLFIAEGLLPVLLGVAILVFPLLPDKPTVADWLSEEEKRWIEGQLDLDSSHTHVNHVADILASAREVRLWLLSAIYFCVVMGLYGFVFYVPTLVKSFAHAGDSDVKVGMLSAIPFLVGAICMVVIGAIADRTGSRRKTVACSAIIAASGLCGLAAAPPHHLLWAMSALCVAAIGIFGTLGPFWALPTRYLRGSAAAAGIAVINSTGALAGYYAPRAMASSFHATGNYIGGLLSIAGFLTLGAILVLCVPRTIDR